MATLRINAWSSPRNVSTALMYAFAQRPDTRVVDEPLYAHYLRRQPTEALHPGVEEILASQENDGAKVIADVLFGDYQEEVVFFKQMTHHLIDLPLDFLAETRNVLLIRDPRAILASFSKVVRAPCLEDIGLPQQVALLRHLQDIGQEPLVLDARELLQDPPGVLRQMCREVGIPFLEAMLSWPEGPRPEDGVWARYWYRSVHRSRGFQPYRPRTYHLTGHLEALARQARPLYEELFQYAWRAGGSP